MLHIVIYTILYTTNLLVLAPQYTFMYYSSVTTIFDHLVDWFFF